MGFDADGLPLEERVDFAGMNPRGLEFRWLKRVERVMTQRSDAVLVRSERAIPFLTDDPADSRFHVVTNGRDPGRFALATPEDRVRRRQEWGVDEQGVVLAYAGSLGPQYCLPEMLSLFEKVLLHQPGSVLLLLTGNPEAVKGVPAHLEHRLIVRRLPASEVASYLGAADIGLALREPRPSMQGVFPIKLGEYLLCGLPVIATAGIGDTRQLLGDQASCLLLEEHTPATLEEAARWAVTAARQPGLRIAARALGLARFSLEESIHRYKKAIDA
jgi:glycosyltransferase involved in cell wall biosynthesis